MASDFGQIHLTTICNDRRAVPVAGRSVSGVGRVDRQRAAPQVAGQAGTRDACQPEGAAEGSWVHHVSYIHTAPGGGPLDIVKLCE